jgi:chemotaxis protein CheY-P-specific phosphatase CheC
MFNGKERQLIGSKKFNKEFYHLDVIKEAVYNLVGDFVQSQSKLAGKEINVQVVEQTVKDMVERCYKSFLDDDYAIQLNNLLPLLDVKRIGE